MNVTPTTYAASIELLRQTAAPTIELQESKAVSQKTVAQATTSERVFEQMVHSDLKPQSSTPVASGINAPKLTQDAAAQQAQAASNTQSTAPTDKPTSAPRPSGAPNVAAPRPMPSGFNSLGNLSTGTNLKDFALLTPKQNLQQATLNQALALAQTATQTAAAAVQPALIIQLGMLQRLYSWSRQNDQRKESEERDTNPSRLVSSDEGGEEVGISQLVCLIFFERAQKLVESCKHLALNRYLKKGPLGEHLHQENTDDEYGTVYADVDAETDYIKRPRHEKPEMNFHYAMLS